MEGAGLAAPLSQEYKMSKCIVETTGSFMLVNAQYAENIEADRPTVVTTTSFIDARIAKGDLKLLVGNLPKEANDEEFIGYINDSDKDFDLAVEAYASKFGLNKDNVSHESTKDVKEEKAITTKTGKRGKKAGK